MLAIVNVSESDDQALHDYEIRINERVIGKFKHLRVYNGAADCLRAAADALEDDPEYEARELMKVVTNMLGEDYDGY